MRSYVQVIGGGAQDSGAFSLLLFFDEKRYLVNCSEGTQRAAALQGVKLSRVDACVVSSLEWTRVGGLPGLLCTLRDMHEQDEEVKGFQVIGPEGLGSLMEGTQPFVRRQRYPIESVELSRDPFTDGYLTIHPISIAPAKEKNEAKRCRSPPDNERFRTMAYLFDAPKILGKFDVQRARSMGLSPGPDYGRLVKGETIILPDGTVIEPGDCVAPATDHPAVAVIDLPTDDHYNCFMEQVGAWSESIPSVSDVFSLSPKDYFFDGLFKAARIHRISLNNQFVNGEFYEFQKSLNAINPSFKLPASELALVKPFTKFHLYPEHAVEETQKESIEPSASELRISDELRVSFLGTAAAIPGKYRNVSGILVQCGSTFMTLDCGEGSLGQLRRLYGAGYMDVVERLQSICLTHIHADHHLGTISLLLARPRHLPPVIVFAAEQFRDWFDEYERISCCNLNVDFITCNDGERINIGQNVNLTSFSVAHCPDAFGFRLDVDGQSIIYSGDTRPCDNLIKYAMNGTLLIHEATMPDDLLDEAIARRHSTVSEAIAVFDKCKCEYCILTHFTQRSAKTFPVQEYSRVAYASDLLSFTIKELPDLCAASAKLPKKENENE